MNNHILVLAAAALLVGCSGSPSTSTSPKPKASVSPSSTATASPAATVASPTPAAAVGTSAASLSLMVGGVAVTVANSFKLSGSGNTAQFIFDKPSGFAPADKWYFDVSVAGKTKGPKATDFGMADVQAVSVTFRQGTGETSQERVYSQYNIPAEAYTLAQGLLDVSYKASVDKLGFGAGGPGGPDKIDVDLELEGLPLP